MAADWYCKLGGKELGPITAHQLKAMADVGRLLPETPVRRGATGAWMHASRVKGLFSGESALPEAQPLTPAKARPAGPRVAKPLDPPQAAAAAQPPAPIPIARGQVAPPAPVPVQTPSGPQSPAFDPFNIVADIDVPSPRGIGRAGRSSAAPGAKKQKQLMLVVALAAGIVILASVGIVVAVYMQRADDKGDKKPDKVAGKSLKSEKGKKADEEADLESKEPGDDKKAKKASADSPATAGSDEEKWTDAAKPWIRRDGFKVRVASAERGWPPFAKVPSRLPTEELFTITLEIENTGTTRKLEYSGWGGPELQGRGLKLTDKHGNFYRFFFFAPGLLEGQQETASVYPHKFVRDLIVFQAPVPTAEYLLLELPAAAIAGEKKPFGFRIPMSMVKESRNPPPSPGKSVARPKPVGPAGPAVSDPGDQDTSAQPTDEPAKPAPVRRRPMSDDEKAAEARKAMGIEDPAPGAKDENESPPAPEAAPAKKSGRPKAFKKMQQEPTDF